MRERIIIIGQMVHMVCKKERVVEAVEDDDEDDDIGVGCREARCARWMTWLRRELTRLGYGHVRKWHIVHFAAECTEYSPLKNGDERARDLPGAMWLAQSGMQLILHLKPLVWFIECSGAGSQALKTQPIMRDKRMRGKLVDVTLCNAGADIRKESSWWTNIPRTIYSIFGFPERPCNVAHGRKCIWELLLGRHVRHVGGRRGGDDATLYSDREHSMQYPNLLCAMWISSALYAMLKHDEASEADTSVYDG